MAIEQKVEAIKKVSEALSKNTPAVQPEELERVAPNREHFQSLLNNTSQKIQPSFQKLDGTVVAPEGVQPAENPIFGEDNVKVQGNGTATDQEQKRRQKPNDDEVDGVAALGSKKVSSSSLMEEVKKLNTQVSKVSKLSPEELKNQAQAVIAQIEDAKTKLSQTQGEIKPSYQNLLRNRLTHIDDNLKIALSKAGVEYTPPAAHINDLNSPNPIKRFIGYLTSSQYQLTHLNDIIGQLGLNQGQLSPASMLALQIKVGYISQQIELFTNLLNKALESTKTIMNVQV
jgi:hypothetical protein